jgi:hypothetical protein
MVKIWVSGKYPRYMCERPEKIRICIRQKFSVADQDLCLNFENVKIMYRSSQKFLTFPC